MKSVLSLGVLSMLFLTFFFLYLLISASSNGKISKQKAIIVDDFYLNFTPNTIHRIVLWLDFFLLYLLYTVVITLMELFATFSVSAWYFSRKKREATLPTTMFMKTALRYHMGTVCKLSI
jgi:predicted NACHT family NTPase